jgi:hypothetical protein
MSGDDPAGYGQSIHVDQHHHRWTAQRGDDRWRCATCNAWISKLVDRAGRVIPLPR